MVGVGGDGCADGNTCETPQRCTPPHASTALQHRSTAARSSNDKQNSMWHQHQHQCAQAPHKAPHRAPPPPPSTQHPVRTFAITAARSYWPCTHMTDASASSTGTSRESMPTHSRRHSPALATSPMRRQNMA